MRTGMRAPLYETAGETSLRGPVRGCCMRAIAWTLNNTSQMISESNGKERERERTHVDFSNHPPRHSLRMLKRLLDIINRAKWYALPLKHLHPLLPTLRHQNTGYDLDELGAVRDALGVGREAWVGAECWEEEDFLGEGCEL